MAKAAETADRMRGLIGKRCTVAVRTHTRWDDADYDETLTGKVIAVAERISSMPRRDGSSAYPNDVVFYTDDKRVYTFAVSRVRTITERRTKEVPCSS